MQRTCLLVLLFTPIIVTKLDPGVQTVTPWCAARKGTSTSHNSHRIAYHAWTPALLESARRAGSNDIGGKSSARGLAVFPTLFADGPLHNDLFGISLSACCRPSAVDGPTCAPKPPGPHPPTPRTPPSYQRRRRWSEAPAR